MNIQPAASSSAAKTDDRSAVSETPGTSAAAAVKPVGTTTAATGVSKAKDAEPTSAELQSAVDKLNKSMSDSSQDLEFSVDKDSKKTVVKLVDRTTHEVLRQMPTKEALEIAKSLDKAMGKLIDQQA